MKRDYSKPYRPKKKTKWHDPLIGHIEEMRHLLSQVKIKDGIVFKD